MVRGIVSPETIEDDAVSYIRAVKEEFHDEPAKYKELIKLMNDYHRHDSVDKGSAFARITEIIKEYPNLLLGLKALFPEEMITIPPKAEQRAKSDVTKKKLADVENHRNNMKKMMQILDTNVFPEMKKRINEGKKSVKEVHEEGLSQLQTKVGRRVQMEPTMDDVCAYIDSVKEALHKEPAKYDEFLKLLINVHAHRLNEESGIARITELIKEHPKLVLDLNVLLPAAKITIPPKAKITNLPKPNSTIPPEASRTIPLKAKITNLPKPNSIIPPEASRTIPLKVMIPNLPKPNSTTPPEASRTTPLKVKITIPPKARRTIPPKARRTLSKKNAEQPTNSEEKFMNKLKTRFQRIDIHVVGSFCEIMKMYNEGKKSVKEVGLEVFDLLYYHEDLIEDFLRIFPRPDPFASTSLLDSLRQKFHDPLALLECVKQYM